MIRNSIFQSLAQIKLFILVVALNASCSDFDVDYVVPGFSLMQDSDTTYVTLPEDVCDIPSHLNYPKLIEFISSQDGYRSDKSASEFIAEKALVLISCRGKKDVFNYYIVEKENILDSGVGNSSKIKEIRKAFFLKSNECEK